MKRLVVGTILSLLLLVFVSTVFAHTYNGTVSITCTDFTAAGTGSDVLDRDNTGSGEESLRIDVKDGDGTILYTLSFTNTLGSYAAGLINTTPYTTAPNYNPITVSITSLAGNGLPEVVQVLGTGRCAGLPELPSSCALSVPEGTVIGDMPFNTQAYWAPGNIASGVIINAGTYHVIGLDATGEYYKIRLDCAFLWVPVSSMQPSFQAPQNGAPLPTRIVE